MTSARSARQSLDAIEWRAGLTLSERLTAMNLNPSGGPMVRHRTSDGKIRWRAERRADIARVEGPIALSLDPPLWLRTFRTAYAEGERRKTPAGSPDGLLVSIEPLLA